VFSAFSLFKDFPIQCFGALRAKAMGELYFRIIGKNMFYSDPTVIYPDALTRGADNQESLQIFNPLNKSPSQRDCKAP